jgi:hypothetical protein
MGTDEFAWYQMAAGGGHAGPASSASYIHQIEHAFALVSQNARPHAWLSAHLDGVGESSFPDVATGLQGVLPPMPPRMAALQPAQTSSDLGIRTREAIIWRVADGLKLQSIASEFDISVDLIEKVVEEMAQAMLQMRLVKQDVMVSIRKQCMAVTAYSLWARSAKQEKFAFFVKHLKENTEQKNFKSMFQLWQDWSLCRDGKFLALVNPRPAARIVNLLLEIGVTRKSLAVSSMNGAVPLAIQIKHLEIPAAPHCNKRSKRAGHRLVLTSRGVDATKATGATISMLGFHWWMLLLGSVLIAKEEI